MMGKMKDSGVEWIGEIPEGWEICKLKNMGKLTGGCGFPVELQGNADKYYPFYKVGDLELSSDGRNMNQALNTLDEEERIKLGAKIIEKNSIIYAKIGAALLLNKRRITSQPCLIDNNMSAFMPFKDIDVIWAYYVLSIINLGWYMVSGAIPAVSEGTQSQIAVPLPSKETQQKISTYLDHKCAQIDAILASILQSIEKLKEYRQAVITRAVTKGLDPDAKMKDSGIIYIETISQEFELKKLKNLLSAPLQYGANESGISFSEELPRYIRITDIDLEGNLLDSNKQSLPMEQAGNYLLKDGDILFARSGATVGKTFLYKEYMGEACFAGYLIRAALKDGVSAKFIYYYTQSNCYEDWKKFIFSQSTIQNINAEKYSSIFVPMPSPKEQENIVYYLDQKTAQIDSLIAEKQKLHDKFTAYKKSLIYEYVTGKREVPDHGNDHKPN